MAKKITSLEINDYKKLRSVIIEPGKSSLMLIGGNNTEGKSSLLGAMSAAIGGGRELPEDPIRHGAKKASIRVVFDDGELIVRRRFTAKGSTLEVTNADGKVSSPQKMLDALVGKRFIDPMKFSRLSGAEQRKVLMGCVDLDLDFDASVVAERAAYDERRDVNRDIKRLEAKLSYFSEKPVPEMKDQTSLLKDLEDLQNQERAHSEAGAKIASRVGRIHKLKQSVEDAKEAFVAAREALKAAKQEAAEKIPELEAEVEALESIPAPNPEGLERAREELVRCSDHNAEVVRLTAEKEQAEALEEELDGLRMKVAKLTDKIETEKELRVQALAAADMPIEGLSFGDDGLILNGSPFGQASGAERLRASIAIAWALSPELCDVWVEDGALLDENSLELVRQYAIDSGLRIWVERVGENDKGAIIMRDGEVVS